MNASQQTQSAAQPPELASDGRIDFFEALRVRRSVRAFQNRAVEEEKLQRILSAANGAPSAGNLQAYEIVVVRDAPRKQALAQAAFNQAFVAQAPVLLVFFAHPGRSEAQYGQRGAEMYALQDATIACAYAELAVAALGLGTVWIGAVDVDAVRQITGMPQIGDRSLCCPSGTAEKLRFQPHGAI